ncbi:MAG: HAD family hydrolase [Ginsengibacter sp.]
MNFNMIASKKFSCKAVIFDMDGTLIESTNADFLAWQKVFLDYGKNLTFNDYSPLLGKRSVAVVKDLLKITSEEERANALSNKSKYFFEVIEQQGLKTVPFAKEFLKHLKTLHIPIALATSSRREKTKGVLKKVGMLSYFDVLVTAEDVINGKPFPEVFLKAASLLNTPAEHCLVFEDAVSGIRAAKNAKMKCVALSCNSNSQLLEEADMIIENFEDLEFKELCQKLNGNKLSPVIQKF